MLCKFSFSIKIKYNGTNFRSVSQTVGESEDELQQSNIFCLNPILSDL